MRTRTQNNNADLVKCVECDRVFDLLEEEDASEWFYGHDCEPQEENTA